MARGCARGKELWSQNPTIRPILSHFNPVHTLSPCFMTPKECSGPVGFVTPPDSGRPCSNLGHESIDYTEKRVVMVSFIVPRQMPDQYFVSH
jgi:hypothetical protein